MLFQTLSFVLAKGFWIYELGGWAPPWGIGLVETPFNALLSGFILVVAILAWFYVRKLRLPGPTGASRERWLLSLFLFFTGTALGLLLIRDAFSLYLLLEVLVIFWAGTILLLNPKGAMDAFRILLWGSAASTLYLFGMLFLTASAGTVQLDDLLAQLLTSKTPGSPGRRNFCRLRLGFSGVISYALSFQPPFEPHPLFYYRFSGVHGWPGDRLSFIRALFFYLERAGVGFASLDDRTFLSSGYSFSHRVRFCFPPEGFSTCHGFPGRGSGGLFIGRFYPGE